jgi:hypothetical protein
MANIRIFGYKNKEGTESWKVALIVAQYPGGFGAISLGKALLSPHATSSFEDIIEAGVAFEELDHRPGRGEGLPQFNDCYKAFIDSGVIYKLAEIPAEKVLDDIEGFKKAVAAIKQADPSAVKETVETKKPAEGVSVNVIGAIGFLGRISNSGNAGDLIEIGELGGGFGNTGSVGGSLAGKAAPSNDKVADALRTLAEALGYNISFN